MQFYVGVTDPDWFSFHQKNGSQELNFWQPKGPKVLRAINSGAPFLFKLRKPYNHIAGIAFYVTHSVLPLSMAWRTFGYQNGLTDFAQFKNKINTLRNTQEMDPVIGCIVLTDPVYFDQKDWIAMDAMWPKNIVQGKTYHTNQNDGHWLWQQVKDRLESYHWLEREQAKEHELMVQEHDEPYKTTLSKVRMGQGAFRSLILNAYGQRCAMTGEKTLPALEAAHIKDHSASGPYKTANGLLLRADLHNLFDTGYLTITPDYHIEVSPTIQEKFNNGKEYYQLHGHLLPNVPANQMKQPDKEFIKWHNEHVFGG